MSDDYIIVFLGNILMSFGSIYSIEIQQCPQHVNDLVRVHIIPYLHDCLWYDLTSQPYNQGLFKIDDECWSLLSS